MEFTAGISVKFKKKLHNFQLEFSQKLHGNCNWNLRETYRNNKKMSRNIQLEFPRKSFYICLFFSKNSAGVTAEFCSWNLCQFFSNYCILLENSWRNFRKFPGDVLLNYTIFLKNCSWNFQTFSPQVLSEIFVKFVLIIFLNLQMESRLEFWQKLNENSNWENWENKWKKIQKIPRNFQLKFPLTIF